MSTDALRTIPQRAGATGEVEPRAAERLRDQRYPIARWYLRPVAAGLAAALTSTRVRPVHLTLCGLAAAAGATVLLIGHSPGPAWLPAGLTLLWWFFDRADGLLARGQQTASAYGAWLDGNVDELVDVALHVAIAAAVAKQTAADWPWLLLVAFLAGKYLLMYGLNLEESAAGASGSRQPHPATPGRAAEVETLKSVGGAACPIKGFLRAAYHLPGNADIRAHVLVLLLATGCLTAELVWVAGYYNLRWIVRHGLVAVRLGGTP